MRAILIVFLVLSSTAVQAHYWVSTNLMTKVESIDPQTVQLKVVEQQDVNKHAYPVGTVLTLKNKKWTTKSGISDEKIETRLVSAKYPNGTEASINKTLTIKPRSTFERMAWLVFGLIPQDMWLQAGDSVILFDTASESDTTLTAIKDPTL
ncbi:MAG: hypothetical protein O3C63_06735 [Cyanobacteria bacterium]|nr:hypothetical protein [Cyanobacteriota bacterium]MDA1021124.1 hypothetical protein [Cyanobacteriota bacterium]